MVLTPGRVIVETISLIQDHEDVKIIHVETKTKYIGSVGRYMTAEQGLVQNLLFSIYTRDDSLWYDETTHNPTIVGICELPLRFGYNEWVAFTDWNKTGLTLCIYRYPEDELPDLRVITQGS